MKIILASKSPRRRELLGKIVSDFEIIVADVDETTENIHPRDAVKILAERKGRAVADLQADALVISSDTLVELSGEPLGKPKSKEDAHRMLRTLSGKTHHVHTGVAVHYEGKMLSAVDSAAVTFREISDREIDDYIETGEPMDKAGAYGIQGGAALFCERMVGDYYNVMGLPVCRLGQVLKRTAPEVMEETL